MRENPPAWGPTVYAGRGDPQVALAALLAASAKAGLDCRVEERGREGFVIQAVQSRPWPRVLAGALPQRARWWIERRDGRLSVAGEYRMFRWYAAVVAGLVLWLVTLAAADGVVAPMLEAIGPQWAATVWDAAIVGSLPLLFVVAYLLTALGGRHSDRITLAVAAAVGEAGGVL